MLGSSAPSCSLVTSAMALVSVTTINEVLPVSEATMVVSMPV